MFTFKICTRINGLRAANSDSADAKWDWRSAKRPQRRRAWRNGSFRRLLILVFFFRKTWQTFLQCFSHHQLVNGFDCWQFVVNASRISQSYFALWGQRIFHWVWLCEQSLFFLLGLPPSFLASRGFAAQRFRARALPLLNLKKKRDCSQSTPTPKGEPNQFRNSV